MQRCQLRLLLFRLFPAGSQLDAFSCQPYYSDHDDDDEDDGEYVCDDHDDDDGGFEMLYVGLGFKSCLVEVSDSYSDLQP